LAAHRHVQHLVVENQQKHDDKMFFRVKTADSWYTVTNGALLRFIIHDMGMTHMINTYVIYCIFIFGLELCFASTKADEN